MIRTCGFWILVLGSIITLTFGTAYADARAADCWCRNENESLSCRPEWERSWR